eukprot:570105-Heterocapsa_arctica.AAC.1
MIKMRTKIIQDRGLGKKRITECWKIIKIKYSRNRKKRRPSGLIKREGWISKSKYKNRYMNMFMVDCCTGMELKNSTRTNKRQKNKLNKM